MGKYVFERHFESDTQEIAILAPLIDYHDPGRIVSGEPNIHSVSFNNSEQFFIEVSCNSHSTVHKVDKINSLLTCLPCVHFCGFYHALGFLLPSIVCNFKDFRMS